VRNWTPALLVLIGAASYGILGTFVVIGYQQGFTVAEVTGSQMFIGALLLWIIALTQKNKWNKISLKTAGKLAVVGSLSGVTGIFYYVSLQSIPASIAIVLLFQFTWIGVFIEWIFEKKRPTPKVWFSLLLITVGTLLSANVFNTGFRELSLFGLVMGLLSAFSYAGFIFVSGKVSTEISPWLRSPLMITGSFIVIFLVFPPTFLVSGVLGEGLLGIALAMAIFGAIIPTVCFTFGVPQVGVGLATILSSVELPVAVFMAWVVLSEEVVVSQWIGVFLILGAITFEKVAESV
jgi:drug/metabolite transporter (DMT)-like permease